MSAAPAKKLEKFLREHGARRQGQDDHVTFWVFNDGRHVPVHRRVSRVEASRIMQDIARRYPAKRRHDGVDGTTVPGAPVIDLQRVEASPHAIARLREMRRQRDIRWVEVQTALQAPSSVRWSERHQSYAYIAADIAVCVKENDNRLIITTILWADGYLWNEHPRETRA